MASSEVATAALTAVRARAKVEMNECIFVIVWDWLIGREGGLNKLIHLVW